MRPQWECERGNFALARSLAGHRDRSKTPPPRTKKRPYTTAGWLLRRADANRDQWRIRGARHRAAGSASLTEELRLIARRPAIGGDQDLIVLALYRALRNAVRSDDPDTRTRRPGWSFFTLRTWRARRTCRTDRACIAFGTLRSGWTGIALRTLAAAGQTGKQCNCQSQMRHAHRHSLPRKRRPTIAAYKIKLDPLAQARTHRLRAYWRRRSPLF